MIIRYMIADLDAEYKSPLIFSGHVWIIRYTCINYLSPVFINHIDQLGHCYRPKEKFPAVYFIKRIFFRVVDVKVALGIRNQFGCRNAHIMKRIKIGS